MNTLVAEHPIYPRYLWLLLILGGWLNALLPRSMEIYQQEGLNALLAEPGGQSFISWLALTLVLYRLGSKDADSPGAPATLLMAATLLLCLIPLASLGWLALAVIGVSLVYRQPTPIRITGILLIALALRGPVSAVLLNLFSTPLLNLDAQLATGLLQLMGEEVTRQDNLVLTGNGVNLMVMTGCSSITNLSWALLLWLTTVIYLSNQLPARPIAQAALLIVLVVAINALRLALMTFSQTAYEVIHDGWGSQLFDALTLCAAVFLSLRVTRKAEA